MNAKNVREKIMAKQRKLFSYYFSSGAPFVRGIAYFWDKTARTLHKENQIDIEWTCFDLHHQLHWARVHFGVMKRGLQIYESADLMEIDSF
jgi:hypothetical protein